MLASLDANERDYCKLHNSFDHSTRNCNMFHQIIQSAINSGQLKFDHAQKNGQLKSIGHDYKKLQNWLTLIRSCNDENIGEKENSNSLSDDNGIVHELQGNDICEDDELSNSSKDTRGAARPCVRGKTPILT